MRLREIASVLSLCGLIACAETSKVTTPSPSASAPACVTAQPGTLFSCEGEGARACARFNQEFCGMRFTGCEFVADAGSKMRISDPSTPALVLETTSSTN